MGVMTQSMPSHLPSTSRHLHPHEGSIPSLPSHAACSTPPTATPSKPRLLYRGPLRLGDGTLLPGVAFVSSVSPFERPAGADSAAYEDDLDICLALEMVRGDRVVDIERLEGDECDEPQWIGLSAAGASSTAGSGSSSSGFLSKVGTGAHGRQQQQQQQQQKMEVTYETTGRVKMFIDPRERLTAAFFERHFCWADGWSTRTGSDRSRSSAVFLVSTSSAPIKRDGGGERLEKNSTFAQALGSSSASVQGQSQVHDPFMDSYFTPAPAPTPFAAPHSASSSFNRKTGNQLVLFARPLCDDGDVYSLEIVIGRRIVRKRRPHPRASSSSASSSSHLDGVGARPDDPLPRSSSFNIANFKDLKALAPPTANPRGRDRAATLAKGEGASQSRSASPATGGGRAASPVGFLEARKRSSAARGREGASQAQSQPSERSKKGTAPRLMPGSGCQTPLEDNHDSAAGAEASATSQTGAGATGTSTVGKGNHTPGRRGEKRQATMLPAREEPTSPLSVSAFGSPTHSSTKRRRADEIQLMADRGSDAGRKRRTSHLQRDLGGATGEDVALDAEVSFGQDAPGLDGDDSAMLPASVPASPPLASTPEPDAAAGLSKAKSRSTRSKPQPQTKSKTKDRLERTSSSSQYGPIETKNRAIIKKLVQHQLLGRGLERSSHSRSGVRTGDDDAPDAEGEPAADAEADEFDRCFSAAYHGTCTALRHTLATRALDRLQAGRIVAAHLGMYLPSLEIGVGIGDGLGLGPALGAGTVGGAERDGRGTVKVENEEGIASAPVT